MRWILRKINVTIDQNSLQDGVFLFGIFIFFAVIVIGLFPDKQSDVLIGKDFFIYAIMMVPIIAAIYFIVMSFRRNLYLDSFSIGGSFRNKMVLAFAFVSILSALPIIFTSNNFINEILPHLASDKTSKALDEAIKMSDESIMQLRDRIEMEIQTIDYLVKKRKIDPAAPAGRREIQVMAKLKGLGADFLVIGGSGQNAYARPLKELFFQEEVVLFYSGLPFKKNYRIDRLHVPGGDILAGGLKTGIYIVVLYIRIPDIIEKRSVLLSNSIDDFLRLQYLQEYSREWGGMFLLSISIIVIFIAILISVYISRNITRPILELSEAAKDLSKGNFSVHLSKNSNDEIGLLVDSFNDMVTELDTNRKEIYQKQILEAWRDMARRVVHEIKNPLTPIRLSAERIKRRWQENDPDIETVIIQGTATIVEEVDVLKNILSEFTKFARLPEMKKERAAISKIIESTVYAFSGHDSITFNVDIKEDIPAVYIDRNLIRQALNNLIQNSIEAMDQAGTIEIEAEYSKERNLLLLSIRDNGPGISGNIAINIFKPGYTRKQKGTGLGLAIVEKIIIEHGGRIIFDPRYEAGALFVIELPVEE